MKQVRIGFVPLTDMAILAAAAERGFAEAEGIDLQLIKEVSWANIRDKLILGLFDAAHMLAPFAIATSLGMGHVRVPLTSPFVLNLNGNAITLSRTLFTELASATGRAPANAADAAKALALVIAKRRKEDREPLTFGMVFPFSTHTYLLRRWLKMGGIDPEHDVRLAVVPPPYMADSLRNGLLDGFCVGSPWNSMAVEAEAGRIAALGVDIVRQAPEKVLALPEPVLERDPEMVSALLRALRGAAVWCEKAENRAELAAILALPQHLALPAPVILDTLRGDIRLSVDGERRADPDFLVLGRETTNRPDPAHAEWLFGEMTDAGQVAPSQSDAQAAAAVYRPDLYDKAMGAAP